MLRLSTNLLRIKRAHAVGVVLLLFIAIICVAFTMTGNEDFEVARREVLLRRIGHEILLQSGDSVSRVLPVKKISKNEYGISFEKAFTFQPEGLVKTTQRILAQDPLGSDYVVNVLNCADASVAYAFAIAKAKKDDIVACIGRVQPKACYRVHITFGPAPILTAKKGYMLGSLAVLAFIGVLFIGAAKPRKPLPTTQHSDDSQQNDRFALGSMTFDAEARKLLANGTITELTRTETRVLRIFAASPNEPIERSRLQKEIWEDEGVIVGRSLDVFISKLRKKLEADPNVSIVVIRGKGYRLEING